MTLYSIFRKILVMPTLHLKKPAFTLIELLITMSILAIMSAMVFPGLNNFAENQQVQQQTLNVVSDIELTKNKALAGAYTTGSTPKPASWGIIFCSNSDSTSYRLRAYDTSGAISFGPNDLSSADIADKELEGGVIFSCAGSPTQLTFERLSGSPLPSALPGPITISNSSGTIQRVISFSSQGRININ